MNNYINPIPDYDKHITEAENLLRRLTDNRFAVEKWSLLWKNLGEVSIGAAELQKKWWGYRIEIGKSTPFEKKWKGYKKSAETSLKRLIKKDLDTYVHSLDVDILKTESAVEWGIRSSQSMIDEFVSVLPYLRQTNSHIYMKRIRKLLKAVINKTRSSEGHSEVIKLLGEFREHSDFITIGQSFANEMVEYYKYLRDSRLPDTRDEVIKYIDIYKKLCSIYAKDMILCYCLLRFKETGIRPTYEEAQPESKNPLDRINYVKRRIPLFGEVYDHDLRNADAHDDIETDSNKHMVTIYTGREKQPKSYTYEQIVSITQGMSALVIAFRLLIIILANCDWRGTEALLR
jgi:hypothetical protein